MKKYPDIKYEENGMIAVITLNRKPANALTIQNCIDIADCISEVSTLKHIHSIIITSSMPFSFFTGSDLDEIYSIMKKDGSVKENMIEASRPVQKAFTKIEHCSKIVIAAINGITVGLGMELLLVCDFRIASELAWFKFAQVNIGIMPGAGGTQRLSSMVGYGRAKELIMTGRKCKADEAYKIGLLSKIVPHKEVLSSSIEFAESLIHDCPIDTITMIKEALFLGVYSSLDSLDGKLDNELSIFGKTYDYKSAFEGINAKIEKRKPNFVN